MSDGAETSEAIAEELTRLSAALDRLNNHRYFKLQSSLWRVALFNLTRGLAFGLGSVVGATILVAILIKLLGSMDFIPVIGDWAKQIVEQIQTP
ncbi:MAG: DUF5665 domain-containing protein [Maritimibacter sp.]|jgi:hypothetical protein